jgi:hypothetical protein
MAIIRGRLDMGGISLGLQSGGVWVGSVNIEESGPFTAVLRVPADGVYSLTIARDARLAADVVRASVDVVSWIAPETREAAAR